MIKRVVQAVTGQRGEQRLQELHRNLIRNEAKIGGQLFGPVPAGIRREFFCLDQHTWVWHEEWTDEFGNHQARTTRYDVRPSGVVKSQDGNYQQLSLQEALNLRDAIAAYGRRMHDLYAPVVEG